MKMLTFAFNCLLVTGTTFQNESVLRALTQTLVCVRLQNPSDLGEIVS